MICSKCNSEIPSGAKFCTVCGTPCAASEPAKNFCAKCGLELAAGAKFCTSCGTSTAANTAPVVNNAQASAVSLNKEPNADDLVAAMNTAAPAAPAAVPMPAPAAAVPTPVSTPAAASVPTPVSAPAASVAPAPVQAPAASVMPQPGYNNGFAPNGAPNAPEMPSFAPTGGMMPPAGDAAGLNGAAVAAVADPAKAKKSPVGKIILIISIVLVAIVGAAAAWFFSNKPSFLSTFMGKPKYAAMVEKETFKKVSKDLDTKALSNQIKTATSVAGALVSRAADQLGTLSTYPTGDNLYLSDKTAAGAEYAAMMNSYSSNPFEGIDVKGMIESYYEAMQTTYGANAITGSMSVNVKDLGGLGDAEDIIKVLNGTTITYDYAATENAFGMLFDATLGNGSSFDVQYVVEDDGSIYMAFPFASKTGFKIKTDPTADSSAAQVTAGLELDPDEITRLLEEVMDIYTNHVKKASVTMDGGSLIVAGKEVSGKLIVADINGKNFENLFKEIFEHIANDEYFSTQIVEYINNYDPGYTTTDFRNDVTDLVSDMNASDSDKLIIKTVVNNSGKTLAKSFAFVGNNEQFMEIAFADNDTESGFELKIQDRTVVNMINEKTDDKNGRITMNISTMQGEDSVISVFVDYSDVEKVEFGKTQTDVGTYKITMSVPSDLPIDSEVLDTLNNSSFTASTTVSGSTIEYEIIADIVNFAKIDLNMDLTISDDTSVLTPPSDVIDLTDIANGGQPDQETQAKLQNFLNDLMNAVEKSGLSDIFGDIGSAGPIGGTTPTPQPGPGTLPNSPLEDAYDKLEEAVWDSYMEVGKWVSAYNVYEGDAFDDAMEYEEALGDLWQRIFDALYGDEELSDQNLEALTKEYEEITEDAESILKGLWSASTIPNAPSPTLPFDPNSGNIDPTPSGGVYGPDGNLITTPAFADER